MDIRKINENEYEVQIYVWSAPCDEDYICGHIKLQTESKGGGDLRCWGFHPIGGMSPLGSHDLRMICVAIERLNGGLYKGGE